MIIKIDFLLEFIFSNDVILVIINSLKIMFVKILVGKDISQIVRKLHLCFLLGST